MNRPSDRETCMMRLATPHPLRTLAIFVLGACVPIAAGAISLADLTSKDAGAGLKAALAQGVDRAVAQLGAAGGFLGNPKVEIPLPPAIEKAERALRMVGLGGQADELKATMNHAAEAAVAEAGPTFKKALKSMSVADAKGILTGGDGAATDYFRRTSADELRAKFKPIVARATGRLKLATVYNRYAGKAAELGLVRGDDADLDGYVTGKALDGLFTVIADEERAIRQDPLGQASKLLKKVFGAQ
jgi:hypothetical protein